MDLTPKSLLFNCGFSRTAVIKLSEVKQGTSRRSIDKGERVRKFKALFAGCSSFCKPDEYWPESTGKHSKFNKHCDFVMDSFKKKWRNGITRAEYLKTFSSENWESMPPETKESHSLSKCVACANEDYINFQRGFPAGPCFEPESFIKINLPGGSGEGNTAATSLNESSVTREIVAQLNASFRKSFNRSFSQSMVKHCGKSEHIKHKESAVEKKRTRRQVQRNLCSSINASFAENAAMSFLAENESFSGYQRKCLAQSFESPEETPKPKKRHISDSFVEQYENVVKEKLREWPVNEELNWTEIGRQCGLTGKNIGQKVKELASECNIDLTQYVEKEHSKLRSVKSILPGNEVSVPSMPTVTHIKDDIAHLIDSGELCLGEPCAPYTVLSQAFMMANKYMVVKFLYVRLGKEFWQDMKSICV